MDLQQVVAVIAGPVGGVAVLAYWNFQMRKELREIREDLRKKDRCEDPEHNPCKVCILCIRRAHGKQVELLAEMNKEQGRRRSEEVAAERARNEALQEESKKTLLHFIAVFRGSGEEEV